MPHPRTIAIGDIHGCANALYGLIDAIAPQPEDQLIVLGDFVDQGSDTRAVIDQLLELRARCQLVCLLGNHEEMLIAARHNREARRYWEVCGGLPTLNSYGFGATLETIPAEHLSFIESGLDYYETDQHFFVHANYDPELPLDQQPPHILRWELLDPSSARRHLSGKTAFVGHTEQTSGEILDLGCVCCLDTACWRYGWLTAIEVNEREIWQLDRFGHLRQR